MDISKEERIEQLMESERDHLESIKQLKDMVNTLARRLETLETGSTKETYSNEEPWIYETVRGEKVTPGTAQKKKRSLMKRRRETMVPKEARKLMWLNEKDQGTSQDVLDKETRTYEERSIPPAPVRILPTESAPKFYGSKDGVQIQEYIREIDRLMGSYLTSHFDWILAVQKGLEGDTKVARNFIKAQLEYARKRGIEDYKGIAENIRRELLYLFDDPKQNRKRSDDFVNCKQRRNETVREFAMRLKTVSLFLPYEVPEEMLIDRFIFGLERDLSNKMARMTFDTLNLAREKATEFELEKGKLKERPRWESKQDKRNKSTYVSQKRTFSLDKNCFRCGRNNHFKKDCKALKTKRGKEIIDEKTEECKRYWKLQKEKEEYSHSLIMEKDIPTEDISKWKTTNEEKIVSLENAQLLPLDIPHLGRTLMTAIDIVPHSPTIAFLDWGSEISVIRQSVITNAGIKFKKKRRGIKVIGGRTTCKGSVTLPFFLGDQLLYTEWKVVPDDDLLFPALIGADILMHPQNNIELQWTKLRNGKKEPKLTCNKALVPIIYTRPIPEKKRKIEDNLEEQRITLNIHLESEEVTLEEFKELADKAEGFSKSQKEQLIRIFERYQKTIKKGVPWFGNAAFEPFDIELIPEAKPKYFRPFRRTPKEEKLIQDYIDELLEKGVIEEGTSPWSSPLFLVPKPGVSEKRVVADYRYVNTQTTTEKYPLQITDQMLERLKGKKIFSTLDLSAGYWQWPCTKRAGMISAFAGPRGHYTPRVLFMGLKNAVPQFQKQMTKVLQPYLGRFVDLHIDDLFIYSNSPEEHLQHLELVLKALEQYGIIVKFSKAHIGRLNVNILGHMVSAKGITLQDKKVDQVRNCHFPRNVKELRSFLGLTGYYRRFIKGYAAIAAPLTQMTRKNAQVKKTPEAQKAFNILKKKICEKPVLVYADFDKPFQLTIDTSEDAIGAVVEQLDSDGQPHPVRFESKVLSETERNYSATERECYGVVTMLEKLRPYITCHPESKVIVDCAALVWLFKKEKPMGKFARWILRVQEYLPNLVEHRA